MIAEIVSVEGDGHVFIHALGRAVRVTAIATSVHEANDYMSEREGVAAIADINGVIFMAEASDRGRKVGF